MSAAWAFKGFLRPCSTTMLPGPSGTVTAESLTPPWLSTLYWGVPQTGFGVRSKLRKRRACTPGHRVSCHVFENLTKLSFHVFWGLTRLSFHRFWGLTRLSFHVVLGLDKALFPRVLGLDKAPFPRVLGLDKALFPRILGLDKALFPHGFGA